MLKKEKFIQEINTGHSSTGDFIVLGGAILDDENISGLFVKAPLKTFNRHGLIAGATGSGKTKTLQKITESLSTKGIPSLIMDIKGDLSGLAKSGTLNPKINERHSKIDIPWNPIQLPVELMTISEGKGLRLRATVSEFGPILFSKILELNDTQSGIVSLVFKYCDDNQLPLLNLKDFRKTLQFLTNEAKEEIKQEYGIINTSSMSTIIRKIVEIEEQGADMFFGEKSFEVEDLLRIDENGLGLINIIRLVDIQDKPKLFSTFILSLLAEIYETLPEVGDTDSPKLVIFIDEAHLIFHEASKALLSQIENTIKLIRSKGIGLFFVTQTPNDIPANVLGQLGMKIQHAIRAFTAKDRKEIKQIAENYPISEFYDTDSLLTKLGIGEAIVTVLSEKGIPTPIVHTLLSAPESRMDILTTEEIDELVSKSDLAKKYNVFIDRESAYEILNKKIQKHKESSDQNANEDPDQISRSKTNRQKEKETPSIISKVANSSAGKQVMRTVAREVTRGLLGVLGIGSTRRRKSNSFF